MLYLLDVNEIHPCSVDQYKAYTPLEAIIKGVKPVFFFYKPVWVCVHVLKKD